MDTLNPNIPTSELARLMTTKRAARDGWDEQFKLMAESGDDKLLDSETDTSSWDGEEWKWPRSAGLHEGKIWISDDFDEPLPDSFWLGVS